MKIDIPFQERWREPMLNGYKICTSRTKRYGKPGDTFEVFGARFELTKVEKNTLQYVEYILFLNEGCHSPWEFRMAWKELHPRKGYDGWQMVWLHEFKKEKPG